MEELFQKYTATFDTLSLDAIASLYRLPCEISDADGVQTYTDKSELVSKFSANCEAMKSFGYKNAQFNILDKQPLIKKEMAILAGVLSQPAQTSTFALCTFAIKLTMLGLYLAQTFIKGVLGMPHNKRLTRCIRSLGQILGVASPFSPQAFAR